jgi:hypothetical protein
MGARGWQPACDAGRYAKVLEARDRQWPATLEAAATDETDTMLARQPKQLRIKQGRISLTFRQLIDK